MPESKTITADEVRAMQARLEQEQRAREAKEQQDRQDAARKADEEHDRLQTDLLRRSWADNLRQAASKSGVRFLVAAKLHRGATGRDGLNAVISDIHASGFKTRFVEGFSDPKRNAQQRFALPSDDALEEVFSENKKGYRPTALPSFGRYGLVEWLLVEWPE